MITAYDALILVVVGVASILDLKTRKIPNWLTLPAMLAGLLVAVFCFGWPDGVLFSLKGLLLGIGIFLIPFMMGGMGGGDVKLMGAIGAIKGTSFVVEVALFGALWGGLLAVVAILVKRRTHILKRFGIGLKMLAMTGGKVGKDLLVPDESTSKQDRLYVPYGVAIFLGVITAYLVDLKLLG